MTLAALETLQDSLRVTDTDQDSEIAERAQKTGRCWGYVVVSGWRYIGTSDEMAAIGACVVGGGRLQDQKMIRLDTAN